MIQNQNKEFKIQFRVIHMFIFSTKIILVSNVPLTLTAGFACSIRLGALSGRSIDELLVLLRNDTFNDTLFGSLAVA